MGPPRCMGQFSMGPPLPVLAKESQIHLSFPQSNESPHSNIKKITNIKIQTTTDQSACMKKIHYRRAKKAAPALALEYCDHPEVISYSLFTPDWS
jgi:hypothetical protein